MMKLTRGIATIFATTEIAENPPKKYTETGIKSILRYNCVLRVTNHFELDCISTPTNTKNSTAEKLNHKPALDIALKSNSSINTKAITNERSIDTLLRKNQNTPTTDSIIKARCVGSPNPASKL